MNKEAEYQLLLKQVAALIQGQDDAISVMANTCAAIHEAMPFWWTGFYIWRGDALRLGPFQGPPACTRIPAGRGVCGTAFLKRETIVVPDVEDFPGHIACSRRSQSEIVVPLIGSDGAVRAVLDVDSVHLNAFDEIDRRYLEEIANLVAPFL